MQSLTFYFQRFRQFVLALSGAHIETLRLVPSERPRFESLGWAILITSGLAVVSMWFALASAMNINGIVAIPVALCWGLVIMGIDRWLVTSMPIDSNRKFALAVPRIVLALLLGTLISTPLVLRIFQTEINAQVATMQQNDYSAFLKKQQSSEVTKQVATYSNELQYLNTVINSKGTANANTAADPDLVTYNKQLASLQTQLTTWTQAENQDLKEYSCQKYGGANCPKAGVGPVANASLANANQAKAQVTKVQGEISQVQREIQARNKALSSNSASAAQNRYEEALTQRPVVQNEYQTAVQRQNQLQAAFYAQNQASHGLLTKLEALSELSDSNTTVEVARILLFLLFLVIECLPVTVKLLQKPGHYEAALVKAKLAESRDVEEYYSDGGAFGGSHAAPAFVSSSVGTAASAPGVVGAAPVPADETRQQRRRRRQAEEEQAAANVFSVWNPTKTMPRVVGDPADDISTQVVDPQARNETAFEFPPSETDPRTAAPNWARSASDGQAGERRAGDASQADDRGWGRPEDRTRQDASGWGQSAGDIGAMWTRVDPQISETKGDYGYAASESSDDAYQSSASASHHGQASHEQDRSLHDALSELDDDAPYSARTDSGTGGMPLNWDDE